MSIFSGLTPHNLRIAAQTAKESPQALAAVAIVGIVAALMIGFAVLFAARHVGEFATHVQEEEERAVQEEREAREADNQEE